jgi:HEAT repeat protein
MKIETVLDALKDSSATLTPEQYARFADMPRHEVKQTLQVFSELAPQRVYDFLQALINYVAQDPIAMCDELAQGLMNHPDGKTRAYALHLLRVSLPEAPKLVPPLLNILANDDYLPARVEAAATLGTFVYWGELEEIPAKVSAELEAALVALVSNKAESADLRRAALVALGFSSRPEVVLLIEEAIAQRDVAWKVAALSAMQRSAEPAWQVEILPLLLSEDEVVRLAAIEAAGELELESAVPILLEALDEEQTEELMRAMIWSLSLIGGDDAADYLYVLVDRSAEEDEDLSGFLDDALDNLTFGKDLSKLFDLALSDEDAEDDARPSAARRK